MSELGHLFQKFRASVSRAAFTDVKFPQRLNIDEMLDEHVPNAVAIFVDTIEREFPQVWVLGVLGESTNASIRAVWVDSSVSAPRCAAYVLRS